ncbi:hypothetical protein [Nocardia sp. NBC_00403]|uniref:hypothetical protein n=1 Tax=Nocardia sp. NBC_00403 TaxID=2975990 RepID=UPI002E1F90A3
MTAILRMKHEQSWSHSRIADQLEISKSAVTRTLTAAQRVTEEHGDERQDPPEDEEATLTLIS